MTAHVSSPPSALLRVDPDPAAAWRRGDPPLVAQLAELELRRWGLRARSS